MISLYIAPTRDSYVIQIWPFIVPSNFDCQKGCDHLTS